MELTALKIANFRNLVSVSLEPESQGFNVIYGSNGSGKTSLLEAIYYLSLGKSFRRSLAPRVIHHSAQNLSLFSHLSLNNQPMMSLGLERTLDGELNMRLNGNNIYSIAEFAKLLPVQLIDSYCHHLLDGPPTYRRKYIDWGVFYAHSHFLRIWKQFEIALKQRNAALKGQLPRKELEPWTEELIISAKAIDQMRNSYTYSLISTLEPMVEALLPGVAFKMHYYSGWDNKKDYATLLNQNFNQDLQWGYTQSGPHKAELKITINAMPAKDILSRGQQKLFVCAMIIARGMLLKNGIKTRPIYLIDDLPSELDTMNQSRLLALLAEQESQIFVTGITRLGCQVLENNATKMFHVKHGEIQEAPSVSTFVKNRENKEFFVSS